MTSAPTPASKWSTFRQLLRPSWLAGAISIGFHGVLFAASPTFSSLGIEDLTAVDDDAERRNVPLVELSADEQARLPDFSQSFYDFESDFGSLEPLSPLFNNGQGSGLSGESANPSNSLNSEPLLAPSDRPLPPPSTRLPFGITRLESAPSPSTLPSLPPSGSTLPQTRPGSGSLEPDQPLTPDNAEDSATATSPSSGAAALRDPDGETESPPAAIAPEGDPTDTLTLQERLQAYTFDAANTEAEDIQTQFDNWLTAGEALATDLEIADPERLADAFAEAAETDIVNAAPPTEDEASADTDATSLDTDGLLHPVIELPLDYESGICLTEPPQKGLIGAWVSSEGMLLGEPEVLRSTGYDGLNQQAIRYIRTLDFNAVESFTGYRFAVNVNYNADDCIDVNRPSSTAPDQSASSEESSGGTETDAAQKSPQKESAGTVLPGEFAEPEPAPTSESDDETEARES